ncbi:MAG TPA: hypothetical protein VFS54_10950 [Solirubrobacterales bacterium]|nr:hypothetical protein [Solirubrobacterales bacterium]
MLNEWTRAATRLDRAKAERVEKLRDAINLWIASVGLVLAVISFLFLPDSAHWAALSFVALPAIPIYVALLQASGTVAARLRASSEGRKRFLETLDAQLAAAVREVINHRLTSFSTSFRIFDRRGLRQLADPDREVPTAAIGELEGLIASLDSGSIGLSGPRGCGKTTLIRSFTEGRTMPIGKELVGLTVAAPVKYDAREFVLHLFASLCERVRRDRPGPQFDRGWQKRALLWLGIATVATAAIGGFLRFEPQVSQETAGTALLLIAYLLFIVWVIVVLTATPFIERSFIRPVRRSQASDKAERKRSLPAEQAAKDYLRQIRFQQSRDAGQSLELNLPFGLGRIGGSSNTTLTRAPWTLPDAVEEFRRFAATLSDRYVVIGIDELDKMESDEAAREFLNNVKGVFGVAGCYFLVSVSEDAMSAFERRGLPLRDVFDSSFDEIQRIGFLDLEQSRMVLESRVTGVPVPFQCLCHCLAGGLPRDLIRITRELVHHYDVEIERHKARSEHEGKEAGDDPIEVGLATLTERLIEAEWRGKLAGATAAGLSSDGRQPWWLTRWLHGQAEGTPDSGSLQDWTLELDGNPDLAKPAYEDDGLRKAQRIAVEMMVFNYYAATMLDLFGSEHVETMLISRMHPEVLAPRNGWVETLAAARQQFSIDPWLSWGLLEQARRATGLTPWGELRSAPAPPPRKWWNRR